VSDTVLGGVASFLDRTVRDQVERGYEVAVAIAPGELADGLTAAGARHLLWQAVPAPGPRTVAETVRLGKAIQAAAPDIVHLHSDKAGFAGRLALRGSIPTVFQPHAWSFVARTGLVGRAARRWERFAMRWTDAVLCVSEAECGAALSGGLRGRLEVVVNGVDLDEVTPADRGKARARLGLGDGVPLAVCVGRLHRQKNQSVLIEIWPAVRERVPGATLALVGDGPDRATLEASAGEGIVFTGEVPDVRDWLAAANVVAQPSRWEGLSLSLLEAMATARAVVVTDVPGMSEVVAGDAGALVAPEDPAALTEAVVGLLGDAVAADALGAAGRVRVERKYDARVQHDAIAALYDDLLR
jgi:glycosyltransferase involved in cell wall biosynthesis